MAFFEKNRFASTKQDWETPQSLFDRLDQYFHFTLDVAASAANTKCQEYIAEDSLNRDWHGNCWLNPPYGGTGSAKLSCWVEKAYRESRKPDCLVVMLIPARTNTEWWHRYCMKADLILFVRGRPKFGQAQHGLPQPLALVVFDQGAPMLRVASFSV